MSTAFAPIPNIPSALHRGEKDLPFVYYQEGVIFQLLHADVEAGLWVVRVRFEETALSLQPGRSVSDLCRASFLVARLVVLYQIQMLKKARSVSERTTISTTVAIIFTPAQVRSVVPSWTPRWCCFHLKRRVETIATMQI